MNFELELEAVAARYERLLLARELNEFAERLQRRTPADRARELLAAISEPTVCAAAAAAVASPPPLSPAMSKGARAPSLSTSAERQGVSPSVAASTPPATVIAAAAASPSASTTPSRALPPLARAWVEEAVLVSPGFAPEAIDFDSSNASEAGDEAAAAAAAAAPCAIDYETELAEFAEWQQQQQQQQQGRRCGASGSAVHDVFCAAYDSRDGLLRAHGVAPLAPAPRPDGDPAAFIRWVAHGVDLFAPLAASAEAAESAATEVITRGVARAALRDVVTNVVVDLILSRSPSLMFR